MSIKISLTIIVMILGIAATGLVTALSMMSQQTALAQSSGGGCGQGGCGGLLGGSGSGITGGFALGGCTFGGLCQSFGFGFGSGFGTCGGADTPSGMHGVQSCP